MPIIITDLLKKGVVWKHKSFSLNPPLNVNIWFFNDFFTTLKNRRKEQQFLCLLIYFQPKKQQFPLTVYKQEVPY